MKEWQIRHQIFHKMFKDMDLGDDLSKETIIEEHEPDKIVARALDYPIRQTKELYYPGKSYCVAIIFAKLIAKHFNEDFYELLNHEDLLYKNDPYFIPYHQARDIYDQIIAKFPWDFLEDHTLGSPNFQKTCDYFYKEFLLHEDTKIFAPS